MNVVFKFLGMSDFDKPGSAAAKSNHG